MWFYIYVNVSSTNSTDASPMLVIYIKLMSH